MLVSITGKAGTGKSTLMVNLACRLGNKGASVALLASELQYASIQYYFGNTAIYESQSLVRMFQNQDVYRAEQYFIRVQGFGSLYIAGVASGVCGLDSYSPNPKDIEIFLEETQRLYDYVLIESTEIPYNPISFVSMMKSKAVLDLIDLSVQGISYQLSAEGGRPPISKHRIRLAAASRIARNTSYAESVLGYSFYKTIPFCPFAAEYADQGVPVLYAPRGDGRRRYNQLIDTLCQWLQEVNINESEITVPQNCL